MATVAPLKQQHNIVQYSDESSLNTLSLCLPDHAQPDDPSRVWLVYIHGGAWRDPEIDATSFSASQETLLASEVACKIAGIASINYRLSPYPAHPTNPSSPHDPARNARHPDHINDVLTAILYLQEKHHFNERYILIGHSCGATLAFQVAKRRYWGAQYESTFALELNVEPPLAIIGVEGIYDIPALVGEYAHVPAYRDMVTNAFGSDEQAWKAASVADADFEESWSDGTHAVLVHSVDDELVNLRQPELMFEALGEQGWEDGSASHRRRQLVRLDGLKHDEVWQDGSAMAEVIIASIEGILASR